MRIGLVFTAVASAFLATGAMATPVDQSKMLKACVMDHTFDTGNVTALLTYIGAIKKYETPKITPITIRVDDKANDGADYELVVALDYGHGRVKATALLTCTYMPNDKPPRIESGLWGLLMTDPTLFVYDATGDGQPPSFDGDRGKIWKNYRLKSYDYGLSDHPF
jgi:hypothetical protein